MNDINTLREQAAEVVNANGFPTTRQEQWRFTDVSPVAEQSFDAAWKASAVPFNALSDVVLVFDNGRFSPEKSLLDALPVGVTIGPVLEHETGKNLGALVDVSQQAFVAMNTASFSEGIAIYLAEDVCLNQPIHVVYLADLDGGSFHLRNLIVAEKGASATVVEEYIGQTASSYWTNGVTEVHVASEASVEHVKIQRESQAAYHFQTIAARVDDAGTFKSHVVTLGSALGRNDIHGRLVGEGATIACNGAYLLRDRQHFDTHLFMDHEVAGCDSRQLYKGILADKARAVFCGRILVKPGAQQTDAEQSNKNLLLDRSAQVHALPQLEIYADDVKCTHGSTVGELDEVALYYLQTRGINRMKAQQMLTAAFAGEVLEQLNDPVLKEFVQHVVDAWLEEVTG